MRERRVGKLMAMASKYLLASRPEHTRATTPRGTCTAAGGLDVETFRGFQLAGELFLLTSFFIEPEDRRSSTWNSFGSAKTAKFEVRLMRGPDGSRWHQMAPAGKTLRRTSLTISMGYVSVVAGLPSGL